MPAHRSLFANVKKSYEAHCGYRPVFKVWETRDHDETTELQRKKPKTTTAAGVQAVQGGKGGKGKGYDAGSGAYGKGKGGPRVSLVDPSCEVTVAPEHFVWVTLQGEWEVGRLRAGALFWPAALCTRAAPCASPRTY